MNKNKLFLLSGAAAILFGGIVGVTALTVADSGTAYAEMGKGGQQGHGNAGQGGRHGGGAGADAGQKGQGGHSAEDILQDEDEGEDSDRPDWAGTPGKEGKPGQPNQTPGIEKGTLFGDMYILLRDENGVPILSPEGYVQPVDEEGNPIPLDEDGHPLDEDAAIEVELGRLNVGRSPSRVLENRLDEAVSVINSADEVSLDEAGRLLLTIDGEEKTIDSPLENLAIYLKLLSDGTLGLTLDDATLGDLAFLNDGVLTQEDLTASASFLAAANDKYLTIGIDNVVYMNTILGVEGTIEGDDGYSYIDYSSFSYDRSDTYDETEVTILVEVADGQWEEQTVNIYDAVFSSTDYSSTSGIDGFAQAVDDARAVIAFVHDNSAPE